MWYAITWTDLVLLYLFHGWTHPFCLFRFWEKKRSKMTVKMWREIPRCWILRFQHGMGRGRKKGLRPDDPLLWLEKIISWMYLACLSVLYAAHSMAGLARGRQQQERQQQERHQQVELLLLLLTASLRFMSQVETLQVLARLWTSKRFSLSSIHCILHHWLLLN